MPLSSRRTPVRWAARVALALSLAWLLAPGEARATCGDGLLPNGLHGAMPAKASEPADAPKAPCHGPHCSAKAPQAPLTPPAPPTAPPNDGWACGTQLPSPEAGSGTRFGEAADHRPVRLPSAIFHPPRITLS